MPRHSPDGGGGENRGDNGASVRRGFMNRDGSGKASRARDGGGTAAAVAAVKMTTTMTTVKLT